MTVLQTGTDCWHERLKQLRLLQLAQETQSGATDKLIGMLQVLRWKERVPNNNLKENIKIKHATTQFMISNDEENIVRPERIHIISSPSCRRHRPESSPEAACHQELF